MRPLGILRSLTLGLLPGLLLGVLATLLVACSDDDQGPRPDASSGASSAAASEAGPASPTVAADATLAPPGLDEVPPGYDSSPDGPPPTPDADLDDAALRALLRSRSATAPGGGQCRADELTATLRGYDVAAGHRYTSIVLRNAGSRTCVVQGVPGIGVRGVWGSTFVPEVVTRSTGFDGDPVPLRPVRLAPGDEAISDLEWTGDLGGSESEKPSLIVLQTVRGATPLRLAPVVGGVPDVAAVDIGQFTTLELTALHAAG